MPSLGTVHKQAHRARECKRQRAFFGSMLVLLFLGSCVPVRALGVIERGTPAVSPSAPSWMDQAIFYEIFPRAFSPSGTLDGVTAKLDDLQTLGVNVLWLMPIHPIGKVKKLGSYGSMYAVRDYYAIDSDLGTKDDLLRFVKAAHQRHMRVILDDGTRPHGVGQRHDVAPRLLQARCQRKNSLIPMIGRTSLR